MIRRIYQAPSSSFPALPDGASAFIGDHTPPLPAPGSTFPRYARTWTILQVIVPGPGQWTFRLAATPLPLLTDH